jgi:hypothetical protein
MAASTLRSLDAWGKGFGAAIARPRRRGRSRRRRRVGMAKGGFKD